MKKEYFVYVLFFIAAISATVIFTRKEQAPVIAHQEATVIQSPQEIKPETFVGEVITLDQAWPSKVQSINLSVYFPPMRKFLVEAKPYARLSSSKGLVKEWILEHPQQILELGQEMDFDQVTVELGLFYCREGDEGLCLSQKVLYHIPLKASAEFQNVSLSYQVFDDEF